MKKHFIFIILFFAVACAPKVEVKKGNENPVLTEFGPTVNDSSIQVQDQGSIENVWGIRENQFFIYNSSDYFRFVENLYKYSSNTGSDFEIKTFASNLMNLFYSDAQNFTSFNASNSSYLQAALAYEGEAIINFFKNLSSDDSVKKIHEIVSSEAVKWPEVVPNLEPAQFVKSIKSYLENLKTKLEQGGVNQNIVDAYWNSIQKQYMTSLNQAEKSLEGINQNSSLRQSIFKIKNVILGLEFLPNDLKNDVRNQLSEAETLQLLIDRNNSVKSKANDLVQITARIWLKLDEKGRSTYIKPTNEALYKEFSASSLERMNYYAGLTVECKDNEKAPKGKICFSPGIINSVRLSGVESAFEESCYPDITRAHEEWKSYNEYGRASEFRKKYPEFFSLFNQTYNGYKLTDVQLSKNVENLSEITFFDDDTFELFEPAAHEVCVSLLKSKISSAINSFVLTSLDQSIRKQDKNLQSVVEKTITNNLYSIREMISTNDSFIESFSKAAEPELQRIMFNTKDSLPGLERSNVGLVINSSGKLQTGIIDSKNSDYFITGAEVLGASLSASYYRFRNLKEIEGKSPDSTEYGQVVFSQINKMLAMLGLRKLNDSLNPSLHKDITGQFKEFDVFKYDCNRDKLLQQIRLLNEHKIHPTPDNNVLRFEKCFGYEDYHKSFFAIPDRIAVRAPFYPSGMSNTVSVAGQAEILKGSSLMMSYFKDWGPENDDYSQGLGKIEYKGFRVLPRTAFVNLSLGLYSVPLRNLKREQTQLKVFDQWGKEIKDWMHKEEPERWKVSSALTDISSQGSSRTVRSADIARFLISIDEFISSIEGIENSKASVITPPGKTKRENLKSLLEGKKQLLQMMVGISNFLMSKFQDADGGFWHSYSLEESALIDKNIPRSLEDQVIIQDALLRTYFRWNGDGVKWSAIDSLYFMNQQMWSPNTNFYNGKEGVETYPVKPYVFLQTLKNLKVMEPLLKDSAGRNQIKEIYGFWDKKFVEWIKVSKVN